MGNFHSRFLGPRTPDEEEGGNVGYPNSENEYKSNEESMLVSFTSIYKATKAILQKLVVSTAAAEPSLPIQNPSPHHPLLAPSPQIFSRGDSSGLISEEEAQHDNNVGRCQIHEIHRDHVVSMPEIRCSKVEINPSTEAKQKVKRSNAEKKIKHYSSRHKILLVGEGDFSFSACLALAFGSATNIIATSLDSQGKPFFIYNRPKFSKQLLPPS